MASKIKDIKSSILSFTHCKGLSSAKFSKQEFLEPLFWHKNFLSHLISALNFHKYKDIHQESFEEKNNTSPFIFQVINQHKLMTSFNSSLCTHQSRKRILYAFNYHHRMADHFEVSRFFMIIFSFLLLLSLQPSTSNEICGVSCGF